VDRQRPQPRNRENPAQVSASARSAANDNTNAHTASAAVIASAHQYVAPTVRARTSSAMPSVAPSNTAGGTTAVAAAMTA
jgi:hypothetical protein